MSRVPEEAFADVFQESGKRAAIALPNGTVLGGQYRVGRMLGEPGGFGLTYLALDERLHKRVAIKEYLPRDLAGREGANLTVLAHSDRDEKLFDYGKRQFLAEARTLARFDHPNIVRVRTFFEERGTAYLVMDYYEGVPLEDFARECGGCLPEREALAFILPILDGLCAVHKEGVLHRDLKPDNIYLAKVGDEAVRPILLDFGAARQAMGEQSRSLSIVLTPGYAPYEQYHRKGEQGPWTDVYGIAATLYRILLGQHPPDALERKAADSMLPADAVNPRISTRVSAALADALAVEPTDRPPSIEAFKARLLGEKEPVPAAPPSGTAKLDRAGRSRKRRIAALAIVGFWIVVIAGIFMGRAFLMGPEPLPDLEGTLNAEAAELGPDQTRYRAEDRLPDGRYKERQVQIAPPEGP